MKCPACLSTMYNKGQTHPLFEETYRMSLHCWNSECPAAKWGYTAHMSVSVSPNQKWICREYHLPFQYAGKWYAMVGEPFQGYLGYPTPSLFNQIPNKQTSVYEIKTYRATYRYGGIFLPYWDENEDTISVPFVEISTDDDMHERARHLFNRLIKLLVFT